MSDQPTRSRQEIIASMPPGIYDEADVPEYTLPDPLICADGRPVIDAQTWTAKRRPEVLRLFQEQVYGCVPDMPWTMTSEIMSEDSQALGGLATRKQVALTIRTTQGEAAIHLLLYVPNKRNGPAPAFAGLNFMGNHTISADPGISLSASWMPDFGRPTAETGVLDHRATEAARGTRSGSWPAKRLIERGYALATAYCGDMDPDYDDGYQNGLHPLFYRPGQTAPEADEWAGLSAWAWGLSRMLDYLQTDSDIDGSRVAGMGLSRLGKTALWAGAQDERFALVISCESGCGGAALSRRRVGETVKRINNTFPHWFCGNHKAFNDQEDQLPVDQHMLVSLVAPRPVYVASAVEDLWSDPRGEFLSAKEAAPVYRLLGQEGLAATGMPGIHEPIMSRIGYHIRAGGHGINDYDWERFMDFADKHMTD